MEGYRHAHLAHTGTGHLTKLYSDTKKEVITSINFNSFIPTQANPERLASLQRKLRIQKDRYLAWGLAWSDDETGPDGNIDESLANAGVTEIVASVMGNVQEVIHELESGRSGGVTQKAGEKVADPALLDEKRYEDLLKDLTDSNDTLYDLSRSRRALARGEHPAFGEAESQAQPRSRKSSRSTKRTIKPSSIADSDLTLVNPMPFLRPSLSPYAGLPPRIEISALILPHEKPPPYESIGVPIANRLVGHLVRTRTSESVQNALGSNAVEVPVLIEYASYDSTYKDTGVPPPLQRLESITTALQPMRPESQHNISLLGYFEDPHEPRIGLVYDLPYSVQNRLHTTAVHEAESLVPSSLLSLIRKSRPAQTSQPESEPPPLEMRFKLALRLTEQLYALHQRDLPHGNVNSSSIIFAGISSQSSSRKSKQLGSPIWASFDIFSKCSVEGKRRPFNLNIYRHPKDQPQQPDREVADDIKFDLYSLALVLLEVGLWQSLGDLYKAKYSLEDFKIRLEKLWAPKLAAKCGTAYMKAVQKCLRICDSSEASSLSVNAVYEAVIFPLRKCCLLLDDSDEQTDALENPTYMRELPTASVKDPSQSPTVLQRTASSPAQNSTGHVKQAAPLTLTPSLSETSTQSLPSKMSTFKNNLTGHMPSTPSFQDYGRKVSLIQQRWRERGQACSVTGSPQTAPAVPSDAQQDVGQTRSRETSQTTGPLNTQQPKPKLKEFPMIDIPQPVQDEWNNRTAVELAKLVDKALKGSRESCSINLTSYGETPETARPTYLVTCASTKSVKQILKRHFRCDPKACYVRVEKGKITRCRRSRREAPAQSISRSMAPRYDSDVDPVNPHYYPQPVCGASIGAYKDEAHLPPVSFGGIVNVDGRPYGMSVHHMLEADEDEDDDDDDDEEDDAGSDTSSLLSLNSSPEPLGPDSESDDNSTLRQPSAPSTTSLDPPTSSSHPAGETPGISPGEGTDIAITQPALDDAITLDLHATETSSSDSDSDPGVAEDHLLSYTLGTLHASSGLKRTQAPSLENTGYTGPAASLPQELDWALFELLPPRVHPFNVVRGGARFCDFPTPSPPTSARGRRAKSDRDSHPTTIAPATSLANARVHCLGRTSGLASGTVASTMHLLRLAGRSSFAASWTVQGEFGVGGDSGAWVVSSEGEVCGHVLAERGGRVYICPMELVLEDVRGTLGAGSVGLPGARGVEGSGGGRVVGWEGGESLEDAVGRLKVEDTEYGGVRLPFGGFDRATEVEVDAEPRRARGGNKGRSVVCEVEGERGRFDVRAEPVSSAG